MVCSGLGIGEDLQFRLLKLLFICRQAIIAKVFLVEAWEGQLLFLGSYLPIPVEVMAMRNSVWRDSVHHLLSFAN